MTPHVSVIKRPFYHDLYKRYSSLKRTADREQRQVANLRMRESNHQGSLLVEGLRKYQDTHTATNEMQVEKTKVCLLYDKIQSM